MSSRALPLDATKSKEPLWVVLPYVICLVAQVPLLLIYFSRLWDRPYYQFFPIALLLVAVYGWFRWPKREAEPFRASTFSSVLFWAGVVFGAAGSLFVEPWFSGVSMCLLLASLFNRTRDAEFPTSRTLLVLSLPLFSILKPPSNLDSWLVTGLQRVSTALSSAWLDLFGFLHYSPGTTLNFPGQTYEVERACSGVQSFFTLVFCATFIIVAFRRGWFRAIILLASAVFWAVMMNSVRIISIPIAELTLGWDLRAGLPHEILGYSVMLFACAMLLSTDQLLEYMLGARREIEVGNDANATKATETTTRVSRGVRVSLMVGAGLMLVLGIVQAMDFVRSINNPNYQVRFFDQSQLVDVDRSFMPKAITSSYDGRDFEWRLLSDNREDRTRGSDLGQRSDQWVYVSPTSGVVAQISLDQAFPGWHELTTCYKHQGWREYTPRRKLSEPFELENGETVDWDFVEIDLHDPSDLRHGRLMFCFCDRNGDPVDAPIEWDNLSSFVERAKNRLSYRFRSKLFRGETYQIQVFVPAVNQLNDELKEEVRQQFFEIRKLVRGGLLKYRDSEVTETDEEMTSAGGETSPDNASDDAESNPEA